MSLLDFANSFNKVLKVDEIKTDENESKRVRSISGPIIKHSNDVMITQGNFKGYNGWVKERVSKTYLVQIEENDIEKIGEMRTINDIFEYNNYIKEERMMEYIIKNQVIDLTEMKVLVQYDDTLAEYIRISDKRVLVRPFMGLNVDKELVNQDDIYMKIYKTNEKNKKIIRKEIEKIKETIENTKKEKADLLRKIQVYSFNPKDLVEAKKQLDKVENTGKVEDARKRVGFLEELSKESEESEEGVEYKQHESNLNRFSEVSTKLIDEHMKLNELENILKYDYEDKLRYKSKTEYMLEKLGEQLRKNKVEQLENVVSLDMTNLNLNLYSIVSNINNKNVGEYDKLNVRDVYKKDGLKILNVNFNMLKPKVGKIIKGSRVEITKGKYRNKTGIVVGIIDTKITVGFNNRQETYVTEKEIHYMDIKLNEKYYQVLNIVNKEDINVDKLLESPVFIQTGVVKVEDYIEVGIEQFNVKGLDEVVSVIDVDDIQSYGPGFQIKYNIKKKKVDKVNNVEQEYVEMGDDESVEQEYKGDDEDDSIVADGDYGDEDDDIDRLFEKEQEYKTAFTQMEHTEYMQEKFTPEQTEILSIVDKLNKIDYIIDNKYQYLDAMMSIVKEIRENSEQVIGKKEIQYIILLIVINFEPTINLGELYDKLVKKKYFVKKQLDGNWFLSDENLKKIPEEYAKCDKKPSFKLVMLSCAVYLKMNTPINILDRIYRFCQNSNGETQTLNLIKLSSSKNELNIFDYVYRTDIVKNYSNINRIINSQLNEHPEFNVLIQDNIRKLVLYIYKLGQSENKQKELGNVYNYGKQLIFNVIDKIIEENQKNISKYTVIEYGDYVHILGKFTRQFKKTMKTSSVSKLIYRNIDRLPFYIEELSKGSELYEEVYKTLRQIIYWVILYSEIDSVRKKRQNVDMEVDEIEDNKYKNPKFKIKLSNNPIDSSNQLIDDIKYGSTINRDIIRRYLNSGYFGFDPITYALIHSTPEIINMILDENPRISMATLMVGIQALSKDSVNNKKKDYMRKYFIEKFDTFDKDTQELLDNYISGKSKTIRSDILVKFNNEFGDDFKESYVNKMKRIIRRIIDMKPENINNVHLRSTPLIYAIRFADKDIINYIMDLTTNELDNQTPLDLLEDYKNSSSDAIENPYLSKDDIQFLIDKLVSKNKSIDVEMNPET